jgi:hypothetical protein
MRTQRDQDTSQTAASEARTGKRKSNPEVRSLAGSVLSEKPSQAGTRARRRDTVGGPDAARVQLLQQLLRATQEKAQDVVQVVVEAHQTLIAGFSGSGALAVEEHEVKAADMDALLERLDQGIAAEQVAMDRLLERMASRTPR